MSPFRLTPAVALAATVGLAAEPKPNRLATEGSPYLLQHSRNPVDWFPWGVEAFEKAKKDGKLVFLSVGYSSCHWCHVMEREAFSDPAIAKLLNDNFVCVKVDREERPDVDDVYMTALHATGSSGGWPLTMFLTADGKPIFGGTYFPPADKAVEGGTIPGLPTVLKRVLDLHRDKKDELLAQADRVADLTRAELERGGRAAAGVALDAALVADAASAFTVDPEWGGFKGGGAAKFPRVASTLFLLGESAKPGNEKLAAGVDLTLRQMALGGIRDHVGGGFHRYSTDRTWTVPHFEKMLYDQAQMVDLYAAAFARTPDPLYRQAAGGTLAFVRREMTAADGGFYSALDADSKGAEGEFYVWTAAEIDAVLGPTDGAAFRAAYAPGPPNFEGKAYVLRLPKDADAAVADRLTPLRGRLLAAREKRERPFLDTKIITGWNGQMIGAFARSGKVFAEPAWTAAGARAADFVLAKLRGPDGRLRRAYFAATGAKGAAFLDDYAHLADGLLALHAATGEKRWLGEARAVVDAMLTWHGDDARGGFFATPHDGEKLFARAKDGYDGAQPSGNGTAANVLLALGRATGDVRYREACEKTLRVFAGPLKASPTGYPATARALAGFLAVGPNPPAGPPGKGSTDHVRGELTVDAAKAGRQAFAVTLAVDERFHVYANPAGSDTLAGAATRVDVYRGGTKVDADVTYPAGKATADGVKVYEGGVTIRGSVPAGDGALEVRVRVQACDATRCLPPATLTLTAK